MWKIIMIALMGVTTITTAMGQLVHDKVCTNTQQVATTMGTTHVECGATTTITTP
jgi:hypothetical protein